ncbi:hypothetical protein PH552_26155, partial [Rhizobium sp. CNPSo 3968]|uniref:hypothetical protein n=1 Tax=Rhizobium sp. CNPSo 3968 TaxID=3021408 RepID=UPI002549E7E3
GPASFAAHVSLSSHLQLSNNRPVNPVKNSIPTNPKPQPRTTNQHRSQSRKHQSERLRRQQRRRPRQ